MLLEEAEKRAAADSLYEVNFLIVLPISRNLNGFTLYLVEPAPRMSMYMTVQLRPIDYIQFLTAQLEMPCEFNSSNLPIHFLASKDWLPLTPSQLVQLNSKPWPAVLDYVRRFV